MAKQNDNQMQAGGGHESGATSLSRFKVKDVRRATGALIILVLILAGLVLLILWLTYRPQTPKFTVISVAIYSVNVSSPPFVSTSMKFDILARNPSSRVSILYDGFTAYVLYRYQAITIPMVLPSLYLEKKSEAIMSVAIGGIAIAVPLEVAYGLAMEEAYGIVPLRMILIGKLRWRVSHVWTGRYVVNVKCDVWARLKKGYVGQVPLLGSRLCGVDV